MPKRLCGLVSGGKDSNYAFYKALRKGYKPVCILSLRPRRSDSWMFHVPHVSLVRYQAIAMGLEKIYREYEVSGIKEQEVEELAKILVMLKEETGFQALSVGAIASRYQYERIKRLSEKIGFEVYAPQWGINPSIYMRNLVSEGFKFIITSITVYGLPSRFLGRELSLEDVEEIIKLAERYGFNPAFEGGEAETLVVDAPHYKKRLRVSGRPKRLGSDSWILDVERVWLEDKLLEE